MKMHIEKTARGFTLLELIITFSIILIIVVIAGIFAASMINSQSLFKSSLETQGEVQQAMQVMLQETRAMATSNTGSYPIDIASTSTFGFYSDVNGDGYLDHVKYFLSGKTIKKGTIKPAGNPLSYIPANEIVIDVIHNIVPGSAPVFTYYDQDYTGSELPLPDPAPIPSITAISIQITAQENNQSAGATFSATAVPRNLRTNL